MGNLYLRRHVVHLETLCGVCTPHRTCNQNSFIAPALFSISLSHSHTHLHHNPSQHSTTVTTPICLQSAPSSLRTIHVLVLVLAVCPSTNYNPINDFNRTKSSTHLLSFSNGYLAPIAQATAMPEQKLKSCPFPGVAKLPQKYTPFLP